MLLHQINEDTTPAPSHTLQVPIAPDILRKYSFDTPERKFPPSQVSDDASIGYRCIDSSLQCEGYHTEGTSCWT